jgi:hypothetical protein
MAIAARGYLPLLLSALLLLAACGDDDFKADAGPGGDGSTLRDSLVPDKKQQPPGWNLDLTIDIDSKLPCNPSDQKQDCQGLLVWGIWTRPATNPKPGAAIHLGFVPDAKKGTTVQATNLPGANKMYLNLFIDDNDSATAANPLPDKGDPIHLDLEHFTAVPNQTIKRTITFWVKMP